VAASTGVDAVHAAQRAYGIQTVATVFSGELDPSEARRRVFQHSDCVKVNFKTQYPSALGVVRRGGPCLSKTSVKAASDLKRYCGPGGPPSRRSVRRYEQIGVHDGARFPDTL
jgi:hypothetical protein